MSFVDASTSSEDPEDCPNDKPGCDVVGGDYCTWAPNTDCYESGWPGCCGNETVSCPEVRPPCDEIVAGQSYCTYAPDYKCYSGGWPSCCSTDGEECPEQQPACEHPLGASYCTWAPNAECYEGGWPACCQNGTSACPDEQPPCNVLDGASVCTFAPDYDCYSSGWPECCTDGGCRDNDEPECDVSSGHENVTLSSSSAPPPAADSPSGDDGTPVPGDGDGTSPPACPEPTGTCVQLNQPVNCEGCPYDNLCLGESAGYAPESCIMVMTSGGAMEGGRGGMLAVSWSIVSAASVGWLLSSLFH